MVWLLMMFLCGSVAGFALGCAAARSVYSKRVMQYSDELFRLYGDEHQSALKAFASSLLIKVFLTPREQAEFGKSLKGWPR